MTKFVISHPDVGESEPIESRSEAEERAKQFPGAEVKPVQEPDGGTETVEPEVVEDTTQEGETQPAPAQAPEQSAGYDLPESVPVDTDPLVWMPDEFTDTIDGTVAINRKGFEVICQHFGVEVTTEKQLSPFDTDHEYAEVKATAKTQDGQVYTAYGTARSEGGDDVNNLLELADTRAYKRAASRATGVGMLAVEEIQGQI